VAARKRKGLGLAPWCIPEDKAIADTVTHAEMQAELTHLRAAIVLIASRLGNELGANDAMRVLELAAPPHERQA
jgi:hypothetical protein